MGRLRSAGRWAVAPLVALMVAGDGGAATCLMPGGVEISRIEVTPLSGDSFGYYTELRIDCTLEGDQECAFCVRGTVMKMDPDTGQFAAVGTIIPLSVIQRCTDQFGQLDTTAPQTYPGLTGNPITAGEYRLDVGVYEGYCGDNGALLLTDSAPFILAD